MRFLSTRFMLPLLLVVANQAVPQSGPPRVAGIALGSSRRGVRSALGQPDREQESLGMTFWDYTRRGLSVIWQEDDRGVRGIVVSRPDAGDVSGIRVGDLESGVRRALGAPARLRQDGRFLDYVGSNWVVSVELHEGIVAQITLLRADAPP